MRYPGTMMTNSPQSARATDIHPPFVLVIDVGSSSTRALLCDTRATIVAGSLVREPSALQISSDGGAEDDPAALFSRVVRCIDAALLIAKDKGWTIAGVGCATYTSNILGLDDAGQPSTPIYTYADTRGTAAAEALRARLDEATILERTGCPLRTSYLPALFGWLGQEHPELLQATHRWASIGEWLFDTFFGHSIITYSAAAWTGLLNRRRLMWDAELLAELPIAAEQFGNLADVDTPFVGLREPWATRWPQLKHIPWFSAVGDGAAANLGSGCVDSRQIALSIGTTGALRMVLDYEPQIPRGLWCYRVDTYHPLLGSATSEGGNVLSWVRQTLRVEAEQLEQWLLDPKGTDHQLTVLPFVAGERGPGWSGDVQATISGISVATTTLDIARAALEAVTYRWALIARLLCATIPHTPLIVASGGGLRHVPSWGQLIADALGLPVALSAEAETTSRGVALLALRSLGMIDALDAIEPALHPAFLPDKTRFAQHQAAIDRQLELYHRLLD